MDNVSIQTERCSGCGFCIGSCPKSCIHLTESEEGFYYPSVDSDACIHCGKCLTVCYLQALAASLSGEMTAYAAFTKDRDVIRSSSSGGIFTELAKKVLHDDGIVYGAAYEGQRVQHIRVQDEGDLWKLRSSKYAQSSLTDIMQPLQRDIASGRQVLFSGTPCQIAGLYASLGSQPHNLLTVDVVCHGIPSEKALASYLGELEKKYHSKVSRVNFRSKEHGWSNYQVRVDFENGKCYVADSWDDPYMRAMITGLSLRKSCYSCSVRGSRSAADITLGDLWGTSKVAPSFGSQADGISLVLAHTAKAK